MTDQPNVPPPGHEELALGPPHLPPPPPLPVMPLGYLPPARYLPPPGKLSFPQQAARASWVAPLISLGLGCLTNSAQRGATTSVDRTVQLFLGGVTVCLTLGGLVLGIVALFGMRRYGREKILTPAIVGVSLNGIIVGCWVLVLLLVVRTHALVARKAVSPVMPPLPALTEQQVQDSLTKSPGWAGRANVGGTSVVVLSVGRDSPFGQALKDAFGTDGKLIDVLIDNTVGRDDFTLDAADFSVVLKDGTSRAALTPDDVLKSARYDKHQLMSAYPWSAVVRAGPEGKAVVLLFLPADIDPAQIDHAVIARNDKPLTIPGQFLSVGEKAANLARSRGANGAPKKTP